MVAEPILVKTRPSRIGERTAHEQGILAEKREVEDRLLEPRDGHPTLSKGVHEAVVVIVVGHAAGKPPGDHAREEVVRLYRSLIEEAQQHFASFEQIKRFTLLDHPFTIEAGELTDTLKLRRSAIARHYSAEIEAMYRE